MLYFKSPAGEVFAYESKEDREKFGIVNLVQMTSKEITAHLNPGSAKLSRDSVESYRLRAYADLLTGSDRLFSESTRMQIMGETGYEEVRTRAIARFEEIQAQYPWPAK
jgi:hypothetical protein